MYEVRQALFGCRTSSSITYQVRQALFGLRTSKSSSSSSTHTKSTWLSLVFVRTKFAGRSLTVVAAARTKHFSLARAAAAHTKCARLSLAFVQVKPTAAHTKCARLSLTASLFVHPHAAKGGCSHYMSLIACSRALNRLLSLSLAAVHPTLLLCLVVLSLCCCRPSLSLSINFTTHLFIKLSVELAFGFSSLLVSRRYTQRRWQSASSAWPCAPFSLQQQEKPLIVVAVVVAVAPFRLLFEQKDD